MGDRALVVFTDGQGVSPAVYLQWHGEEVTQLLEVTQALMGGDSSGRNSSWWPYRDPEACVARFIGICAQVVGGNTGLGVQSIDGELEGAARTATNGSATGHARLSALRSIAEQAEEYGLDAGLVIVDVRSVEWSWRAFGGYLEEDGWSGLAMGAAA